MLHRLKENSFSIRLIQWLGLFSSFGTLFCCALPSAFVLLGLGSTLANFIGFFPQIIWISEHKEMVFGLSFFFMGFSFLGQMTMKNVACDLDQKESCERTKNWSRPVLWITLGINVIGFIYAYVLGK